jgi:beta-galactosidase
MIGREGTSSRVGAPAGVLRRVVPLLLVAALPLAPGAAADDRVELNLNPGWRFLKADVPGAAAPGFDDAAWSLISTPHTFNDVDTFDDWSLPGHRGEQDQWSGRTWYRKRFTLPAAWRGRKVFVEFEGVRQVAEVYLNGRLLGVHKTGFTPFGFDLTPLLRFGEENLLAVMCDNRFLKDPLPAEPTAATAPVSLGDLNVAPRAGSALARMIAQLGATIPDDVEALQADQIPWNNPHWHPAHGGIYRNVRLHVTDPLHVTLPLTSFLETVGPYAYASEVSDASARVGIEVPVRNDRPEDVDVEVVVEILDRDGHPAASFSQPQRLAAGATARVDFTGRLQKPELWEPERPYLYRVVSRLRLGGETVDSVEVPLGIRSGRWDKESGFSINGRRLKLRGWGQKPTDEWPGLGAAQPDWLHFFTLGLMKDAGANLVRWGHCAGGPASIAAGDRLGLVTIQPGVDGESDTHGAAWKVRVQAFRDAIVYFRNSPSILIWEGGNQKVSREHARELRGLMDRYDPHGGRAYAHRRADHVTAEFMDVGIGTEGGREIAELPVVEGEYDREESPRRVWDDQSPPRFGYPEAAGQTYQLTSEQFAVNQVRHYVTKLGAPDHSGGANWIFSDSTSGGRVGVEVARASGEVDGVRLPKEAYFACRAMFRDDAQAHIVGHWSYPAGTRKTVHVVSNAEQVELARNGVPLGRARAIDRYLFSFPDVAFEPGELKAVAYANGLAVAEQTKRTAGPPASLRLTPIVGPGGLRADAADVVLLDVEAVDAVGERCPTLEARVDFEIEGPAVWRGGYNSGKLRSVNNSFLDLEAGVTRVALRATLTPGTIRVRASSPGLRGAETTLRSLPATIRDGYSDELPGLPEVRLGPRLVRVAGTGERRPPAARTGRVVRAFSYSGPTPGVTVAEDAQDGKRVYLDLDETFASLPSELRGADYVLAAEADAGYPAVDLMELAVPAGSAVYVAHDDRIERPAWLTRQFRPTAWRLSVGGHFLTLFERAAVAVPTSLTLGANSEDSRAAGHMYVVFAARPAQ